MIQDPPCRHRSRWSVSFLAGVWLLLNCTLAQAGALWLNEFATPAMGRAGAGAEAGVGDASASIHNPASMTELDGHQILAGFQLLSTEVEFDIERSSLINGNDDGGDQGGLIPAGGFYYTGQLNDKWWTGFSLTGRAGAAADPNDTWVGRFQMTESSVVSLIGMPSLAYKVSERVSLAVGIPIAYSKLELDVAVPTLPGNPQGKAEIDGDDVTAAINLSAHFKLSENTRLGLYYQSEFDTDYGGDASIEPPGLEVGIDTSLPKAAKARAGITHDFGRWRLHGTAGWEEWSTLDSVNLSTDSGGAVIDQNWDDTWHFSTGFDVDLTDRWAVQSGIAYDTDPTRAEDRRADLPFDEQWRFAVGGRYRRDNGQNISAQFVYAWYGDAEIQSTGFGGEYDTFNLFFLSVSADWRLGRH